MNKNLCLLLYFLFVIIIGINSNCFAQSINNSSMFFSINNMDYYTYFHNNVRYYMESSYDRSGGNDDGFGGKYSVIGKKDGNSVIVNINGCGMITRIWFPLSKEYPDYPLGLKNKRILIYLNGQEKPAIDMPLVEMFNNNNHNFSYPISGVSLGGCWSYMPISFTNGAKVVIEGDSVFFFHVQYNNYLDTLSNPGYEKNILNTKNNSTLENLIWNMGDYHYLEDTNTITKELSLYLHKGTNELTLPEGSNIIEAFIIKGASEDIHNILNGNLTAWWDSNTVAAIKDIPLSMFFIQEEKGLNDRSLMAGKLLKDNGVYNFFPMPYKNSGRIQFNAGKKCNLKLILIYKPVAHFGKDMCYLHIAHRKEFPTIPGKKFNWLDVYGKGHFVGIYMRAKGKSLSDSSNGIIYWTGCLEGDEIFTVDRNIIEHGTGTEDYFNAGWNGARGRLDHPQCFPFHGFTKFDAAKDSSAIAAYRWRLPFEVVPFFNHFKAEIEVGPEDNQRGNYESIAYYYLTKP